MAKAKGMGISDKEVDAMHGGRLTIFMNAVMHLPERRRVDSFAALDGVTTKHNIPEEGTWKEMKDFSQVKAGDVVTREVAGVVPMLLVVKRVDEKLIWATRQEWFELDPDENSGNYWTFDRQTGAEVDEDLGWGPEYNITGSCLVGVVEVDDVAV